MRKQVLALTPGGRQRNVGRPGHLECSDRRERWLRIRADIVTHDLLQYTVHAQRVLVRVGQ